MGIQSAIATSDAQGCDVLTLIYLGGEHNYYSWRVPNGISFWEVLHQLVHAPVPIRGT